MLLGKIELKPVSCATCPPEVQLLCYAQYVILRSHNHIEFIMS